MWIWIIIGACVIGALIGFFGSKGNAEDTAGGAMAGGCMAAGCIARIAVLALIIIGVLWLFGLLFG